jgi:hypothetical protein
VYEGRSNEYRISNLENGCRSLVAEWREVTMQPVKSEIGPVILYANALFADRDNSFTTNSMRTALRETQNITLA